jgi:membrane-bound hydrogenase subunit beta
MAHEQDRQQTLTSKFPFLEGKVNITRERRMWVDVPADRFHAVIEHVHGAMEFGSICIITGLDEGENLTFIYHLAHLDGTMMNLKTSVPKSNPVHRTVTYLYPSALLYERELCDCLGAKIEGLPAGPRYPLPDDWPLGQFPLRKDWTVEQLKAADKAK